VEVTSASEYRKKKFKTVTLPSGAVFRLKKPSLKTMKKLFDLTGFTVERGAELTDEQKAILVEKAAQMIDVLLPECVDAPKISTDPESEDVLSVDELDWDDSFKILDEIFAMIGFSPEAIEERESFREKPTR